MLSCGGAKLLRFSCGLIENKYKSGLLPSPAKVEILTLRKPKNVSYCFVPRNGRLQRRQENGLQINPEPFASNN